LDGAEAASRTGQVKLVLAQGISASGDTFLLTAASIAIFRETGSPTAVSLLLGLAAVPTVLLGPFAGAVADWYSRLRIMIAADLLCALACLAGLAILPFAPLTATVFLSVGMVYSLSTFYRPAAQALLPAIAGPGQLGRANSALRLATSLASILGPAGAGVIAGRSGFSLVLLLNGASFLASAGLVALIRGGGETLQSGARHSPLADALAGLDYARRSHRIRIVISAIGLTIMVGTVVNAGTLPLVSRELDLPASRYGALLAVEGAGAMCLAVVFMVLGPRLKLLTTGAGALLAVGASTLALGSAPGFLFAAAAIAVQGMSVVALQVAFASYLQQEAADAFRGRVMALTSMVASVAGILGFAAAGPLIDAIGVREAFAVAGGLICLASLPVITLAWTTARLRPAAETGDV
jgi:MFS family permease